MDSVVIHSTGRVDLASSDCMDSSLPHCTRARVQYGSNDVICELK